MNQRDKEPQKHSDKRIQDDLDFVYGKSMFKFLGRDPNDYKIGRFKCTVHKVEFTQGICQFKKGKRKTSCPCMKEKRPSVNEIPLSVYQERVDKYYPKGVYEIVRKVKNTSYLIAYCHKHNAEFRWRTDYIGHHISCRKCGGERVTKGKTLDPVVVQRNLNVTFGYISKTNTPAVEYLPDYPQKARGGYKYFRCNIHNTIYEQYYGNTKGHLGCPYCIKVQRNTVVKGKTTYKDFIDKGRKIHHNLYVYPRADTVTYESTRTKVMVFCKRCESHFPVDYTHHIYRSQGCKCNQDSKGENNIKNCLEELKIPYERQYAVVGDREAEDNRFRFDFFIEKKNLLIEYDGRQHFEPVEKFGGAKGLERNKENDAKKDEIAKTSGITLVRISYDIEKPHEIMAIVEEVLKKTGRIEIQRYGKAYPEK